MGDHWPVLENPCLELLLLPTRPQTIFRGTLYQVGLQNANEEFWVKCILHSILNNASLFKQCTPQTMHEGHCKEQINTSTIAYCPKVESFRQNESLESYGDLTGLCKMYINSLQVNMAQS